jgi:hypothetical protein
LSFHFSNLPPEFPLKKYKGTPVQKFWEWFSAYSKELVDYFESDRQYFEDILYNAFAEIEPGIAFEYNKDEDGVYELIISAAGDPDLMPVIMELYKAAPELKKWKFTAFQPRASIIGLQYRDIEYSADTIWYNSILEEGVTHITAFLPGMQPGDEEGYMQIIFNILVMTLGELDLMTRVGAVAIEPLPENPGKSNLKPLSRLADEIDMQKAKFLSEH